ncbi:hypothetical protein BKA62DRAFT_698708, partial [Auriculariales sp. MPI-PUGE-AT-0066]
IHKRLQHIPAHSLFIMKTSTPKSTSKRMPKSNASLTATGSTQPKTKAKAKASAKTPTTPVVHRQRELLPAPLLQQAAQLNQQSSPLQPQPQPTPLSLPQLTYANLMAHRAALGMHQAAESAEATRKRKASDLDDDHIAKRAKTSSPVTSVVVQDQPQRSTEAASIYTIFATTSSTLNSSGSTGSQSSPSDDESFDEFVDYSYYEVE